MNLSNNFTLAELTKTSYPVENIPTVEHIENLRKLCVNVLQPIRDSFRRPVKVNSGYRSAALNKLTKGSQTSDHLTGLAADIEISGVSNRQLAEWIRDNLEFKELILEHHTEDDPSSGWVHVSYDEQDKRKECLRAISENGRTIYLRGLHA